MPEGPEVNVIKDGLNRYLKNTYIIEVNLPEGSKFLKKTPDGLNDFKQILPLKLIEVKSKGKLLYFEFEKGWYMICRLLMAGGWYLDKAPKHNHLELIYSKNKTKDKDKGNVNSIWFVDPRHFGTIKWTNDKSILDNILNDIGDDLLLLANEIKEEDYLAKMKNKKNSKRKLASVLMDQSVYSGIGNYLKSEILYQTKISPHAIVQNIPDDKLKELLKVSIDKIKKSYISGGASVRDYSDIKGTKGEYSFTFSVYHKKTDPLGNKIKIEKTKDGRTTYWVPDVQVDYTN